MREGVEAEGGQVYGEESKTRPGGEASTSMITYRNQRPRT